MLAKWRNWGLRFLFFNKICNQGRYKALSAWEGGGYKLFEIGLIQNFYSIPCFVLPTDSPKHGLCRICQKIPNSDDTWDMLSPPSFATPLLVRFWSGFSPWTSCYWKSRPCQIFTSTKSFMIFLIFNFSCRQDHNLSLVSKKANKFCMETSSFSDVGKAVLRQRGKAVIFTYDRIMLGVKEVITYWSLSLLLFFVAALLQIELSAERRWKFECS